MYWEGCQGRGLNGEMTERKGGSLSFLFFWCTWGIEEWIWHFVSICWHQENLLRGQPVLALQETFVPPFEHFLNRRGALAEKLSLLMNRCLNEQKRMTRTRKPREGNIIMSWNYVFLWFDFCANTSETTDSSQSLSFLELLLLEIAAFPRSMEGTFVTDKTCHENGHVTITTTLPSLMPCFKIGEVIFLPTQMVSQSLQPVHPHFRGR